MMFLNTFFVHLEFEIYLHKNFIIIKPHNNKLITINYTKEELS